jgi:hypothetical protein
MHKWQLCFALLFTFFIQVFHYDVRKRRSSVGRPGITSMLTVIIGQSRISAPLDHKVLLSTL